MNDMALQYAVHRITVDEYHRMDDAAVFPHDARIELIEGELFERTVPMNPPHAYVVALLDDLLRSAVAGRAILRCQLPITLGDFSEPEPDFAIVAGSHSQFKTRHPSESEIEAVIEVADSSRDFDVRKKVPLYAKYGIPEILIVDLVESCVRTYRDPLGSEYRITSILSGEDLVSLSAFPEFQIRARSFFK
jgi:Uma2 family endonuclease